MYCINRILHNIDILLIWLLFREKFMFREEYMVREEYNLESPI